MKKKRSKGQQKMQASSRADSAKRVQKAHKFRNGFGSIERLNLQVPVQGTVMHTYMTSFGSGMQTYHTIRT
jgi:septal ring factor EnvC (AmiA/AmiB activator)